MYQRKLLPISKNQTQLDLDNNKFIEVPVCNLWKDGFGETHIEIRRVSR